MKATRERKLKHEPKKEQIINFKIDKDFKNKYQSYCLNKGYSISKRIRVLMKADFDEKIKI